MPDDTEMPEDNFEQEVDYITGKLGDDETDAAPEAESKVETTEDAAPADEQPSGDDAESEPEAESLPLIEAPLSWSAEAKETFKSLPREAQQVIADRERNRDVELRRAQNEAADIKKAVETERQQIAVQLQNALALANYDPVVAEGLQTDWTKLANENPADYIAKKAAFDDRVQKVQMAQARLNEFNQQQLQQRLAEEDRKLVEKIPEWADPVKGKAELADLTTKAKSLYGIELPRVMAQLPDHGVILVLRDAIKLHDMQAAQKTAKAKQVQTPPKRVQKPGGREESGNNRALAWKQRAAKTGVFDDRVNAVMAALDED